MKKHIFLSIVVSMLLYTGLYSQSLAIERPLSAGVFWGNGKSSLKSNISSWRSLSINDGDGDPSNDETFVTQSNSIKSQHGYFAGGFTLSYRLNNRYGLEWLTAFTSPEDNQNIFSVSQYGHGLFGTWQVGETVFLKIKAGFALAGVKVEPTFSDANVSKRTVNADKYGLAYGLAVGRALKDNHLFHIMYTRFPKINIDNGDILTYPDSHSYVGGEVEASVGDAAVFDLITLGYTYTFNFGTLKFW